MSVFTAPCTHQDWGNDGGAQYQLILSASWQIRKSSVPGRVQTDCSSLVVAACIQSFSFEREFFAA